MTKSVHVGLIGEGIGLSRTPRMHIEAGRALGLDCRYDLFDTAGTPTELGALLDKVAAQGLRGVNVTHPYKRAVMAHLHRVSDAARAVGAVNTVVFEDGMRIGHNTDYWGFAEAFRRGLSDVPRDRVLLLGAGGAGGAVAHALLDGGVDKLYIFDVQRRLADDLCAALNARFKTARAFAVNGAEPSADMQGLVNATPVGMAAHPGSPVPVGCLRPPLWVADIIYFPLETALLRAARLAGCRVMNGADMAVFQAVRAFELFTGHAPDPAGMRATFDAFGSA